MKYVILSLLLTCQIALADAVVFSGSDVKALKTSLDLFGTAKVMGLSADPSSGGGQAAPLGSIGMNYLTGNVYMKTGAGATAWSQARVGLIDLTSQVTGILPIANGGTSFSSYTKGDVLYALSSSALSKLPVGTSGQYLMVAASGVPSWSSLSAVTSVTASGPISSTGGSTPNISLSGVVAVANGGTNSSAALNNNRIMVSSSGSIVESGSLANGQFLIGSTGSSPVIAAITAGTGVSVVNGAGSVTISNTQPGGDFFKDGSVAMTGPFKAIASGTAAAPSITFNGSTTTGLFNNSSNTIGFAANGAEAMRVSPLGFVGIGNTNPGSALDVKGTLRLSGSVSGYVGLTASGTAGSTTYTLPVADGTSGQALTTNGSGALSWATAGSASSVGFYGGMSITGGNSGCYFYEDNSTGFSDYQDLTGASGCPSWTVDSGGIGTISAVGTNSHQITVTNMASGNYLILLSGEIYASLAGGCVFRVTDGTSFSTYGMAEGAAIGYPGMTVNIKIPTTATRTLKVQAADGIATGCYWRADTNRPELSWKIYKM